MSEDEPPYETTADDWEQLGDYVREALTECVAELGFAAPLVLACISANGSVFVVRTDGENVEQLALHTEGASFALPLNFLITDARGEATRLLITNEGKRRLN